MSFTTEAEMQPAEGSGFEPLRLNYETVTQFSSQRILLRSTLTVHSLEVGVLEQEQYRYVVRRTSQSEQLFQRQLKKVLDDLPRLRKEKPFLEAVTIPVYNRMLQKANLASSIFDALTLHPGASPQNLCMEVSADLLFEDLERLTPELKRVRDMGVKIAVWELGDPFCPLLRLAQVPYDYLFLDSYPVSMLSDGREAEFRSLCAFLHTEEKTRVFAPDLPDGNLCPLAESLGCDGYTLAPDAPLPETEEGDA